jgi:ribose transport system substrate-binding protein
MSKLWISRSLAAALLVPLAGCGSSHAKDEKYYLVAMNVKLPYWQTVAAGLTRSASQLGVQAEMVGPDTFDPKAEHDQFLNVISQKPTGILVSAADPNLMNGDIDSAISQGIPVVTIDSDAPQSKRLTFIGTDNYKAGLMGGKVLARQLKFRGAVTVFTMPEQHNLQERLQGYKDAFEAYPQIKITELVDAKGDPKVVFDKTTEMIDKNIRAEAIVCLVSFACPQVAQVLDQKKVTGKVVMAMDTDDKTLVGIQKGLITATIGQKPFTMALLGLKLLDELHHHPLPSLTMAWAQDSFSPLPKFIDTGATLIDQDNVDKFIGARASATGK